MTSYQQKADHTCGAACVRTVLARFRRRVLSERTLAQKLNAKFATGIEPGAIVDFLRSQKLIAEYKQEKNVPELLRRLQAGWVPIVCWADWGGHYCVVAQYEPDARWELGKWSGGKLSLADPAATYDGYVGITPVSRDRFKSMWYTPYTKKKREVIYVKEMEDL